MNLDPRIDDLSKEVRKVKRAIKLLTRYVDSALWRVSSGEERLAGIFVREEIKRILEGEE